jgi:hypothetical protein
MKDNPFDSMNPICGRERTVFESISILQCKCNAQFPFRCQYKQSFMNEQFLYVFFKYFNKLLKFDFQCFQKGKNKILKENLWFTFQEKL